MTTTMSMSTGTASMSTIIIATIITTATVRSMGTNTTITVIRYGSRS